MCLKTANSEVSVWCDDAPAKQKWEHEKMCWTDLLDVLKLEHPLIDGRVRNIVAFGILKHQRQIWVNVLNALILIVLHLVPGEYYGSHSECVTTKKDRGYWQDKQNKSISNTEKISNRQTKIVIYLTRKSNEWERERRTDRREGQSI